MGNKIELHVGDKVICADGKAGYVTETYEIKAELNNTPITCAVIKYEDGSRGVINEEDYLIDYKNFYLIGHTILGNKLPVEVLSDMIADVHQEREQLKAKEQQLRKQRWRLEYQMGLPIRPVNYEYKEGDK